ncbi:hypothetical protein SNEBB_010039 [Seison nebaliae]|nr:hypothetical protein SNEBB_010039 [Seison nebaliae]
MYRKESKSDSKNIVIANKQKGNELFKNEKYEDAIAEYKEARKMLENVDDSKKLKAILHQNIGACLQRLGKDEQVIEQCDLAIQFDVKYAKAYWRKSQILAKQNNEKEALFNITISAILEKFSVPETLVQAEIYLKTIVIKVSCENLKETPNYPPVSRGRIYDHFSSFYRDIFCYQQIVMPIIEGNQREVESSENSKLFFHYVFDSELCSIRDTYLSGAFSDTNEIANVVKNLKLFIQKQVTIGSRFIHSWLELVQNVTAAWGFLGSINCLHGQFDEAGHCYDEVLSFLKPYLIPYYNDEVIKLLEVSILLNYSKLELHLNNSKEALRRMNEAEAFDDKNIDIYYRKLQQPLPMNILRDINTKAMSLIDISRDELQFCCEKDKTEEKISKTEKELLKMVKQLPESRKIRYLFMRLLKEKNFVNIYEMAMVNYRMTMKIGDMKELHSEIESMLMRENNSLNLHKLNLLLLMEMEDFTNAMVTLKQMIPLTKHYPEYFAIYYAIEAITVHLKALNYLQEIKINDFEQIRRVTSIEMKKAYDRLKRFLKFY